MPCTTPKVVGLYQAAVGRMAKSKTVKKTIRRIAVDIFPSRVNKF